jgi:antirestriction protein
MEQEPHEQQEGEDKPQGAETRPEQSPEPNPRIYVASLSDYNSGILHGAWLSANVGHEELAEGVQAMLAASPTPGAEEYGIFDYDGFGPVRIDEYERLETVTWIGNGISEHGMAYAHWAALVGTSELVGAPDFEDAYRGHWESAAAYAEELLDDIGVKQSIEEAVPDYLQAYVRINVKALARDMEAGGEILTSKGDGGVYIFERLR